MLGAFPTVVDAIAAQLGIAYPPILVVVAGSGVMVVKMVTMDIERTREIVKVQRLAQRVAMLEGQLTRTRENEGVADRRRGEPQIAPAQEPKRAVSGR